MKNIHTSLLTILLMLNCVLLNAQNSRSTIQEYLTKNKESLELSNEDIANWKMSSEYKSKHNGITHAHIQQTYNGLNIFNAMCNFAIDDEGKVINTASSLVRNAAQKINTTSFVLNSELASGKAIEYVSLKPSDLSKTEISKIYHLSKLETSLRLSYHIVLYTKDRQHVWNIVVDGVDGNIIDHWDQVIHCQFGKGGFESVVEHNHRHHQIPTKSIPEDESTRRASSYNVFALPAESPIHGPQTTVSSPEFLEASPYGWHDTDGNEGAEYTITRGNNVFAYEDADNNNQPGYSPDGGANLVFDFPYTEGAPPLVNQDAALTNLFYMNNVVHDVLYAYGFDEPSGNFQRNNYGNGGSNSDEVEAEGLDGAGFNNANFFTPNDGINPAMQMFLWQGASEFLYVNTPSGVAGQYVTNTAAFGPDIPTIPLTEDLVLFNDGVNPVNDACENATNASAINGKIAILDRGDCTFVDKIQRAQDAGAIAVVLVNNVAGPPAAMGGTSFSINIPSVMVSMEDGAAIKAAMLAGPVNVTIVDSSAEAPIYDGDFDNGIITHEYGHGISTRLVGGRFNSNCLNNDEQMGEGWSDWYGLMLTLDINAANPIYRPIGAFVRNEEPSTALGIRPAPYDTSFTVNDFTYEGIADVSIPHGVGFVWSTMLWDMTWALIDEYGYDSDLYNGVAGNNIALQLVTDGLKLTACSPSFTDGRDAILMADEINYGGANKCLLWKVFARRGLGESANKGVFGGIGGEVEAFDIPASCNSDIAADFIVDTTVSCDGNVAFTDQSTGGSNSWNWDFGDGNTSTEQNPNHQYEAAGTFTVSLMVSNGNNTAEEIKEDLVTVILLETPTGQTDITGCVDDSFVLNAASENETQWYNTDNELIATGSPFETANLTTSTTFYVSDALTMNGTTCESELLEVNISLSKADFSANVIDFTSDYFTLEFIDQSQNATSWDWSFGDGNNSNEQNPIHTYEAQGTYVVELSINNKQCFTIVTLSISATGIKEDLKTAGVELYPNPAENSTMLKTGIDIPKNSIIQLVSIDGKVVREIKVEAASNAIEINLKDVANGTYVVTISLDNQFISQKKLIVNKK